MKKLFVPFGVLLALFGLISISSISYAAEVKSLEFDTVTAVKRGYSFDAVSLYITGKVSDKDQIFYIEVTSNSPALLPGTSEVLSCEKYALLAKSDPTKYHLGVEYTNNNILSAYGPTVFGINLTNDWVSCTLH
jgi:hypothetical protein